VALVGRGGARGAGAGPRAPRDRGDAELFATVVAVACDPEPVPELDPVAVEATLGALHALAYERVRVAGAAGLPGLAGVLTYVALVPFLGAEEAYAAAVGEG
jgi:hypothetical protein